MSVASTEVDRKARDARTAAAFLHHAPDATRRRALAAMAEAIRARRAEILAANRRDLDALADRPAAFRDRLTLTDARIEGLARALDAIALLPDPIGQDESVYRTCAEQIWQDLEAFVRDLTP